MGMPIYFYHAQGFELWHIPMLLNLLLCLLMLVGAMVINSEAFFYDIPRWLRIVAGLGVLWGVFLIPFGAGVIHLPLIAIIWDQGGTSAGITNLLMTTWSFGTLAHVLLWKPKTHF